MERRDAKHQFGDRGHVILGARAAHSAQGKRGMSCASSLILYAVVFGLVTAATATVMATMIEAQAALADTSR
jgi:hypothetical protein